MAAHTIEECFKTDLIKWSCILYIILKLDAVASFLIDTADSVLVELALNLYFEEYLGRNFENFKIQNQELWDHGIETENIECDRNDY